MLNGAGGALIYGVNVKNISAHRCTTGGYFGVSAYDPAGDLVTSHDRRVRYFGDVRTVSVASGATIGFRIELYDTAEGESCQATVGALHLIPPNGVEAIQVATPTAHGYPALCQDVIVVGAVGAPVIKP